jgi:PmbA protein
VDGLVRALTERGAASWSVCSSARRQFRVGVKDREIANAHSPVRVIESGAVAYRVVWDDGTFSRGSLERREVEDDPAGGAERAHLAAHVDPDAAWIPPPAPAPDVALWDAGAASAAAGEATLAAGRLASMRRRTLTGRFRTWSASIGASASAILLRSSTGLDDRHRETSFGWHLTLDGEVGGGFGGRAAESDSTFEERVERIAADARALGEPPRPLAAGIRTVLLHPDVVESWVLAHLLWNLGGSAVADGEGRFRPEEFGSDRPALREDVTIRVDPLVPLRAGSYRYSGEGVPAARCTFVERGRLVSPILGVKYARRLDRAPTAVPHGSDTVVFEGSTALELAAAAAEADALVLSVLGVHTQDAASGDFSLSAPQCLSARGRPAGRLRLTLSGNLFDLLRQDSLRFVRFPLETTPGLLVSCHVDPR